MGGRGASSGRGRNTANIRTTTGVRKQAQYTPKLTRVGNSDFYSDEYGLNTIKKVTEGARAGAWRAEMAPTRKDGIPEGVPIPTTMVSYHEKFEDAITSIRGYHNSIQDYIKRNKR